MTFGIDFDGTFTADPDLWRAFVHSAKAKGHKCVCVTARADQEMLTLPSRHWGDEVREALGDLMPIVFCDSDPKELRTLRAGWNVDVWIDDDPAGIPM